MVSALSACGARAAGCEFSHLDLVIALDVTGSMRQQIAALKAEIGQLSRLLVGLTPSLGIGVVAFGDRNYQRPVTTFALRRVSDSSGAQAALRHFVDGLSTRTGIGTGSNGRWAGGISARVEGSQPYEVALASEQRVIVLITDNPAYPEEVDQAITEAASFAAKGDGRVSTVLVNNGRSLNWTESFLERVAAAGRGQLVRDASGLDYGEPATVADVTGGR